MSEYEHCGLGRPPCAGGLSRRVWVFMGVSAALHALLLLDWLPPLDRPQTVEPPHVRPFTKQTIPARRLLTRHSVPRPTARPLKSRMAARSAPAAAVAPLVLSTARTGLKGMPMPLVEGVAPPPDMALNLAVPWPAAIVRGRPKPGALAGERVSADAADLSLDMLDVDALDTGRHRATVIVDPTDQRNLKGFLYLSSIYSESIERAELESPTPRRVLLDDDPTRLQCEHEALQGLADRMTQHTGVRTQVLDGLRLDDPLLSRVPFVLLTVNCAFTVTSAEARSLGEYMMGGGFLYAEVVTSRQHGLLRSDDRDLDVPALRELIRQALNEPTQRLGQSWRFARLPQDHPLYHSYYDIDSLPRGMRDIWFFYWPQDTRAEPTPPYLEGIWVDDTLVGLYSLKNYADMWSGLATRTREQEEAMNYDGIFAAGADELPAYDLGINILVYALTREGSLAHKLVAAD